MPDSRHNPTVPGNSLPSAGGGARRCTSSDDLRTALDVIRAAAANLRNYRERLTPEEHTASACDIEEAADHIARRLETAAALKSTAGTNGKRSLR